MVIVMERFENYFFKLFSTAFVFLFAFTSIFSFVSNAQASDVEIVKDSSTDKTTGKRTLTGPYLTNFDAPAFNKPFDNIATIQTNEGYQWDIPVIWVDEKGRVATTCLRGVSYAPVFAFYVPENVVLTGDDGSTSFSIKMPEFLTTLYKDASFLSVSNPSTKITFITTSSIVDFVGETFTTTAVEAALFTAYNLSDTAAAPVSSGNTNSGGQGQAAPAAPSNNATPAPSPNPTPSPSPTPDKDLVEIHCSAGAIELLGKENLSWFTNLVRNVIEPQAVNLLMESFPAYTAAANNTEKDELGRYIGLYIYDERAIVDKAKDDEGALAYVWGTYDKNHDYNYSYLMAVNTCALYDIDENTGEVSFDENEIYNLHNTIVHELMHAFMNDYNRVGMLGILPTQYQDIYTNKDNGFPAWFVEGSASAVENVYEYRNEVFKAMRTNLDEKVVNEKYTEELLLSYYANYYDSLYGGASISIDRPDYDHDTKNIASRYVTGYLACLYLAKLALEVDNDAYVPYYDSVKEDFTGTNSPEFNSYRFCLGFDSILRNLHEGKPLNTIVNEISGGRYADTAAFQNAFLTENDGSVDFCVDFLNYLNDITNELTERNNGEITIASGSILLPFDTELRSPIEDTVPSSMPAQTHYIFTESKDFEPSTVDEGDTYDQGGLKWPGIIYTDNNGNDNQSDDSNNPKSSGKAVGKNATANEDRGDVTEVLKETEDTKDDTDNVDSDDTDDDEDTTTNDINN